MSNTKENRMKTKDIAMIGIFGALLFVITMLTGSLMALSMAVQMYSVATIALLSAPLYMLVMSKVHKKGAVIGICSLVGILWVLFGGFFVLIWMIALGIVGEIIVSKTQYQNYKTLTISFGLYTVAYYLGAIAPIYYYPAYVYRLGYPAETSDALIATAHTPVGYIAIPVTIAAIILGAIIAKSLLKKHFEKAGVV
ncbi:MptD family putative ECF transporter S component [Lachnoclostridium sp. Marseille-P6806]|uniref:MptD family putative ECF transporter S component n=1 Tax=Lachnoclostridium sp. Marseille-P6806 TaxID=2364793 RepID=UPI001031E9C8|nr:MptD family putative ECF transporter S component [Lachnoclostridium sp. Marseille-P6806]